MDIYKEVVSFFEEWCERSKLEPKCITHASGSTIPQKRLVTEVTVEELQYKTYGYSSDAKDSKLIAVAYLLQHLIRNRCLEKDEVPENVMLFIADTCKHGRIGTNIQVGQAVTNGMSANNTESKLSPTDSVKYKYQDQQEAACFGNGHMDSNTPYNNHAVIDVSHIPFCDEVHFEEPEKVEAVALDGFVLHMALHTPFRACKLLLTKWGSSRTSATQNNSFPRTPFRKENKVDQSPRFQSRPTSNTVGANYHSVEDKSQRSDYRGANPTPHIKEDNTWNRRCFQTERISRTPEYFSQHDSTLNTVGKGFPRQDLAHSGDTNCSYPGARTENNIRSRRFPGEKGVYAVPQHRPNYHQSWSPGEGRAINNGNSNQAYYPEKPGWHHSWHRKPFHGEKRFYGDAVPEFRGSVNSGRHYSSHSMEPYTEYSHPGNHVHNRSWNRAPFQDGRETFDYMHHHRPGPHPFGRNYGFHRPPGSYNRDRSHAQNEWNEFNLRSRRAKSVGVEREIVNYDYRNQTTQNQRSSRTNIPYHPERKGGNHGPLESNSESNESGRDNDLKQNRGEGGDYRRRRAQSVGVEREVYDREYYENRVSTNDRKIIKNNPSYEPEKEVYSCESSRSRTASNEKEVIKNTSKQVGQELDAPQADYAVGLQEFRRLRRRTLSLGDELTIYNSDNENESIENNRRSSSSSNTPEPTEERTCMSGDGFVLNNNETVNKPLKQDGREILAESRNSSTEPAVDIVQKIRCRSKSPSPAFQVKKEVCSPDMLPHGYHSNSDDQASPVLTQEEGNYGSGKDRSNALSPVDGSKAWKTTMSDREETDIYDFDSDEYKMIVDNSRSSSRCNTPLQPEKEVDRDGIFTDVFGVNYKGGVNLPLTGNMGAVLAEDNRHSTQSIVHETKYIRKISMFFEGGKEIYEYAVPQVNACQNNSREHQKPVDVQAVIQKPDSTVNDTVYKRKREVSAGGEKMISKHTVRQDNVCQNKGINHKQVELQATQKHIADSTVETTDYLVNSSAKPQEDMRFSVYRKPELKGGEKNYFQTKTAKEPLYDADKNKATGTANAFDPTNTAISSGAYFKGINANTGEIIKGATSRKSILKLKAASTETSSNGDRSVPDSVEAKNVDIIRIIDKEIQDLEHFLQGTLIMDDFICAELYEDGKHEAEKTLYIAKLRKFVTGRGKGRSRYLASTECAKSLIQELTQLRRETESMVVEREPEENNNKDLDLSPYEVIIRPELEVELAAVLKELNIQPVQIEQNTKMPVSLICDDSQHCFTPAVQRNIINVQWSPPSENWDPWKCSEINVFKKNVKGSMRDISDTLFVLYQKHNESSRMKVMWRDKESVLPVILAKSRLLKAVETHSVVLIRGRSGCGKTTQVAQLILDDHLQHGRGALCNIILSHPCGVSSTFLAKRISSERNEKVGESVGFNTKYEPCLPRPHGGILICSHDHLLRQLEKGLKGISHIILDDIHSKSMECELLLIILRDIIRNHPHLRIILISDNTDTEALHQYFNSFHIFDIPVKQFPIKDFYLKECIELLEYVPNTVPYTNSFADPTRNHNTHTLKGLSEQTCKEAAEMDENSLELKLIEELITYIQNHEENDTIPGTILIFLDGRKSVQVVDKHLKNHKFIGGPLFQIIQLHHHVQLCEVAHSVFEPAPDRVTKVVLSTSIAESLITVNGVMYVIDTCKSMIKKHTASGRATAYTSVWSSKDVLENRRNCAGHKKPGFCFRLISEEHFHTLDDHVTPEILQRPLHNLVFFIKVLKLGDTSEVLDEAINPPSKAAVMKAEAFLKGLKVLDSRNQLTSLGRIIYQLPLEPRLAKMVVVGCLFSAASPLAILAANISSQGGLQVTSQIPVAGIPPSVYIGALDNFSVSENTRSKKEIMNKMHRNSGVQQLDMKFVLQTKSKVLQVLTELQFEKQVMKEWNIRSTSPSHTLDIVLGLLVVGLYPNICRQMCGQKVMTREAELLKITEITAVSSNMDSSKPSPFFVYRTKTTDSGESWCSHISMVSPLHLLLFGCEKVEFANNLVTLDNWIDIAMKPETAAAIVALRSCFENVVSKVTEDPKLASTLPLQDQKVVNLIYKLCQFSGLHNAQQLNYKHNTKPLLVNQMGVPTPLPTRESNSTKGSNEVCVAVASRTSKASAMFPSKKQAEKDTSNVTLHYPAIKNCGLDIDKRTSVNTGNKSSKLLKTDKELKQNTFASAHYPADLSHAVEPSEKSGTAAGEGCNQNKKNKEATVSSFSLTFDHSNKSQVTNLGKKRRRSTVESPKRTSSSSRKKNEETTSSLPLLNMSDDENHSVGWNKKKKKADKSDLFSYPIKKNSEVALNNTTSTLPCRSNEGQTVDTNKKCTGTSNMSSNPSKHNSSPKKHKSTSDKPSASRNIADVDQSVKSAKQRNNDTQNTTHSLHFSKKVRLDHLFEYGIDETFDMFSPLADCYNTDEDKRREKVMNLLKPLNNHVALAPKKYDCSGSKNITNPAKNKNEVPVESHVSHYSLRNRIRDTDTQKASENVPVTSALSTLHNSSDESYFSARRNKDASSEILPANKSEKSPKCQKSTDMKCPADTGSKNDHSGHKSLKFKRSSVASKVAKWQSTNF